MSRTAAFRQLVREYMHPSPVLVPSGTSCVETISRMTDAGVASVVVIAADGAILGIVTERDVTRRVAFRLDRETPVDEAMTTPVRTVTDGDYLYRAIATMRRARLRHMPVVGGAGEVVGLLELHQALAASSEQLVGLIDRLTHEGTVEGLKDVKAAQVEVADALFGDNVPAPEVQSLLSDMNIDIHRRVVDLVLAEMGQAGWGAPPVAFSVIVMGSGGRGESYLFPDQDNGFILEDYADSEHGRIDPFFIELAERMTTVLDDVGIPLCRGNVMATNPVWRKTLGQWRDQVNGWMHKETNVTLRFADILFDFRSAWGEAGLADELRAHIGNALSHNPTFLRAMYGLEREHRVALGLFGRLRSERDYEHGGRRINLKYAGTLPLMERVRLLALKAGIGETSTLGRIDALHEKALLDANAHDYLGGGFRHITHLLLRQQIADFKAGREVGNHVPTHAISRREKDMLIDCFRAIADFGERVKHELTGEIF